MKPAKPSLWRVVAYASLFALLRFVVAPFGRFVVLPLLWVIVLVFYAAAYSLQWAFAWCRTRPDCPAGRAVRSVVAAALAGAPFFFLLAVAGLIR